MKEPSLTYQDVANAADNLLKTYHTSSQLPIPIEEIVELKMNIAIVAVPGIKQLLGIDAFISSDFTQITVDQNSLVKFTKRIRFSIAHEIGHLILHKEWYEKYGPKNFEDYLTFYDRIDNEVYKFMEIQASTFAGLVLVPPNLLLNEFKVRIGKIPHLETPEILIPIAQDLLEVFEVSGEVMFRRLQKEKIIKSNS
jgi:Zn-dependent peptidase ImmA (M78 family)